MPKYLKGIKFVFNDGITAKDADEWFSQCLNRNIKDIKISSALTVEQHPFEPNLTRDTIVEIRNSKGTVKRRIDFSDTLRVLGVNSDSLPTIEKILEARREHEEGRD